MKFGKMILTTSMLLAPTLAWGIAQQDPNYQQPASQQLRQDQSATMPSSASAVVGTIVEVRDDSFSVRKDADQSLVWFTITPDLKQSASAELVTGNHVRVTPQAGASGDRMAASSIKAEAGGSSATASTMPKSDTDRDLHANVNVDKDSASASVNRDTDTTTTYKSETTIAQNDTNKNLRNDDSTYETNTDRDQLPKTASSLPEIGALGLLALVGAAAVAIARKF